VERGANFWGSCVLSAASWSRKVNRRKGETEFGKRCERVSIPAFYGAIVRPDSTSSLNFPWKSVVHPVARLPPKVPTTISDKMSPNGPLTVASSAIPTGSRKVHNKMDTRALRLAPAVIDNDDAQDHDSCYPLAKTHLIMQRCFFDLRLLGIDMSFSCMWPVRTSSPGHGPNLWRTERIRI
jgi:hypothetical protein